MSKSKGKSSLKAQTKETPSEAPYQARHRQRIVTAAALFDGHDAAINVMRRLIQASGAEVIHLGHNRSVHEIVTAAVQEDVQAVAITSYQGGHNEFFRYLYDQLKEKGASEIHIYGGGGGVIVEDEIESLQEYGIKRIFSPEDGRQMGLQGMINHLLKDADFNTIEAKGKNRLKEIPKQRDVLLAKLITSIEQGKPFPLPATFPGKAGKKQKTPVLGFTGTGGAGKSSLVDEFLLRYLRAFPEERICVLSIDPSKRKTGGALLGDRIRMNSVYQPHVYMRSMATRGSTSEVGGCIKEVLACVKQFDFDLIIVESSGIGQADTGIVDICDLPVYVMTADFGAPTQLEKIDMLDFAQIVAINKFDRPGSEDALREVRKQYRRTRQELLQAAVETLPIFGTTASKYGDPGVTALFHQVLQKLNKPISKSAVISFQKLESLAVSKPIIPDARIRYLGEIVDGVRKYHEDSKRFAETAQRLAALEITRLEMNLNNQEWQTAVAKREAELKSALPAELLQALQRWPETHQNLRQEKYTLTVHGRDYPHDLYTKSLCGLAIPRLALPREDLDWGSLTRFFRGENLPGYFPFTGGVFLFKRADEDPRRQFAGEGGPERTNKRFHYLSRNDSAKRLSTAFDSVTLYGMDPDRRPDIYGKVGESGVSICSLQDMKKLYEGFNLADPMTSVSMTINGPAPIILAMFFNTAVDQAAVRFKKETGRTPTRDEQEKLRAETLQKIRGTVQADILKEDQAQNTCIFSTEFALRMMGDIQEYFSKNKVRHFYSVSISGYHIAEAGANPISQLAFTLANGFTYVEYYLSRGLAIDDFAHNLSFFFSNGLDPEYSVMGRVARRIWAIAMKQLYGANERSQKLKYHVQTSGRSLHAQEIDFNDIRTTLQALLAVYDHCNSLHTNAYDEAITTPTEQSVRRAMAIQMIIAKELGMTKCDNPLQGNYLIDELTDLVEEAVLAEFERLNRRGGVLGAMELQYQRNKIQEESLTYERLKHSGAFPIIGVNTFTNPQSVKPPKIELARSNTEEKNQRLKDLKAFQQAHDNETAAALKHLQQVVLEGGNTFSELMNCVRVASLGQITQALYEVGGQFRRSM